jgi:hypothetical protein
MRAGVKRLHPPSILGYHGSEVNSLTKGKSHLLLASGLIAALSVGLGLGWLAWGRRGGLDQDEATRLLTTYVNESTAPCVWGVPRKRTDTVRQFFVDEANVGCAKALVEAGIANVGDCLEKCGLGCCYWEIAPTGNRGSKWTKEGLEFNGGSLQFGAIRAIAAKDNVTTVIYTRIATLDPVLMKALEPCVLQKTEEGEKERSRTFRRDVDGSWTMIDK